MKGFGRGGTAGGGASRRFSGLVSSCGAAAAALLAFAGQFLISLRAESIWGGLVPGILLYVAALVLLVATLRAARTAPSGGPDPVTGTIDAQLGGQTGWILLALVLAFGFYLRLYRIDVVPPGLNNDEAINAIEANEIAAGKPFATVTERGLNRETMFHYLAAFSYRNPGLGLNLLRAMPAVFGLSARFIRDPMADLILPLRAVAILVGGLTILILYLFARAQFGPRPALLAAIFLAVSPWHLLYSRVGLRTILTPPFAILTVALFLRALRTGKWFDHLAWGLAAGFGFWTYTSFRAVPLALVAFLVFHSVAGRRNGEQEGGRAPAREWSALAGLAVMAALFLGVMAWSRMTPAQFLFRGAYATTPPQSNWGLNLFHSLTMLNYLPGRYAVIQSDGFISDGVSAAFGLIGLEPDTLLLAALASLGLIAAVWQVVGRRAGEAARDGSRTALAVILLCLASAWLTVGWLGPSLTRMLLDLPWFCLLAALLATRVWDDLARWKPPLTAWAAGLLMAGVVALASIQGLNNYFWLAGRSPRAMQHFGATQTIMGMYARALPADQDIVVLHTQRVDTLHYLIGNRPHVLFLTETAKVNLESILRTPRTITFVVEYARPFAEPLRSLMARFPQGDMSQVADARIDPDKVIFYTFTLWKDAAGQIVAPPNGPAPTSPGIDLGSPPPS